MIHSKKMSVGGDTLVEVILSLSLLTLLLVTAWSLTNRATQLSSSARMRTSMVNELRSQAELLKAQRDSEYFMKGLYDRADAAVLQVNPCDSFTEDVPIGDGSSHPADSFHLQISSSGATQVVDGSRLVNRPESRVWIKKKANHAEGYVDFYIQGCWMTFGGRDNLDNSVFVVRLNQ